MNNRLVGHQYTGVGLQTGSNFDGTWRGSGLSTTEKDYAGYPCGSPNPITFIILNHQITGTAVDAFYGSTYNVVGYVDSNGAVTAGIAVGEETVIHFAGTLSGNKGNGSWSSDSGCRGTCSITKQ